MHVVVTTDGSTQSLDATRRLMSFADPTKISDVSVVAVVRPLAAVPFADDVSPSGDAGESFRAAAARAVATVASELEGWGPRIHQRVLGGSAAKEVVRLAGELDAGLVVVASGGRGLSDTVLLGSTAHRIQQYAPCPVLVVRPGPRGSATPRP